MTLDNQQKNKRSKGSIPYANCQFQNRKIFYFLKPSKKFLPLSVRYLSHGFYISIICLSHSIFCGADHSSVILDVGKNLSIRWYPLSILISSENHIFFSNEISNPSSNSIINPLVIHTSYVCCPFSYNY